MAHISVMPVKNGAMKLSGLTLDNKWHSWLGDISKVVTVENSKGNPFSMSRLAFGSMHTTDQTGLFSKWNIDDVILGPAVSTPEQLTFSANYFEFAGVKSVRVSTRQGGTGFGKLSQSEKDGLKWTSYENKTDILPSIDGLKDGLCFMFIQALGKNDLDSTITEVPFLLDRDAPDCTSAFEKDDSPECNGTMLKVEFKNGKHASPIHTSQISLSCDDHVMPLSLSSPRSRLEQRGKTARVYLNWPHILREQLNASTNGQTINMVLSDIADGAGNTAPDMSFPLTIDYSKDHRPPSIISVDSPTNVLWHIEWKKELDKSSPFKGSKRSNLKTVWPDGEEPYVRADTHKGKLTLTRSIAHWSITNHPYMSFRIRQESLNSTNNLKLGLLLDFGGPTTAIALTPADDKSKAIQIPSPIDASTGIWQRVTLNLPELLHRSLKARGKKPKLIKSISFTMSGANTKTGKSSTMLLQSVCIHRAWRRDDVVKIDAYDASGMGEMTLQHEYDTDKEVISPLKEHAVRARWISVRARDKAGNQTRPYRYPVVEATENVERSEKSND